MTASAPLGVALLTSARAWRGSCVSLANIARALADRGHRPHLLAGETDVVRRFGELGLPATQVPTANTGLREALALRRALRAARADVLVVDRPRDLRLGALASLGTRVAILNRYNLSRTRPPPDLLSRLAVRRVSLTVFLSESSASAALGRAAYLHRRPHRIIPGGVDVARFNPAAAGGTALRARLGLGQGPYLLAVGSLTADKRYDFIFDAVARLGPGAPPLLVCGGGPLDARLREQARALGVDARFLGLVAHDELPALYAGAACLLHACAIETFGLSVLEAMASGIPVVAVRGGAVPEVLGEAGVLVPPDDAAGYAEAVRALLADGDRRAALGRAGRARAVERFSLERMRAAYVETIESLRP